MFEVIGKEIHLTRGNIACLNFPAKIRDISPETGETITMPYKYKVGDVVRFKIMKKKDVATIYLEKDVKVTEETDSVDICLDGYETKFGELIDKPTVYWYEVELNPDTAPQTILGYDKETGPKLFVLYPEGGDKNAQ